MADGNYKSGLNNIWVGLIAGLLIPFLSVLVFYYSSFNEVSVKYFMEFSLQINVLPKLISVCAIPNLGVFFLFMWRNHLYSARGVILASFIITFFVIGLKIFV